MSQHPITSTLRFKLMALTFKVRDFFCPREHVLAEAGIKKGDRVLDYGCGSGSYIRLASALVGTEGKVYALDAHPAAVAAVERLAAKKGLHNVKVIHSNCQTGLPDGSVDVVLLYDVLHHLDKAQDVLAELRRVLRPGGTLSVSDHHMKDSELVAAVTRGGMFVLANKGAKTHRFLKAGMERSSAGTN